MEQLEMLLIIGISLLVLTVLIELGIVFRPKRKITEHNTAKGINPKVILPDVGEVTLIGGKRIGEDTFPVTEEFGKDKLIPVPLKPFVNTFPTNPEKLLFGDPSGMTWIHVDETSEMYSPLISKIKQSDKKIEELIMRNNYLEEENRKINERFSEKLSELADEIGEVKKKFFTYIPKQSSNSVIPPQE